MSSYNTQMKKFLNFMGQCQSDPKYPTEQQIVAYFMSIKDSSDRPKSLVNTNSAALNCFFKALNLPSPINDHIRMLLDGITKAGTAKPMKKSSVMPREPFVRLFKQWPVNAQLQLEKLRLKCITLLSLSAKLRPSDIAPQAVTVTGDGIKNIQFTRDQIVFTPEGMKITLFGIKNDYSRDGFEINIVRCSDIDICPVDWLWHYTERIGEINPDPKRPVFTPLNYHFSGLSSSSIAKVLCKAIDLAGMGGQGFTAKSFRPTGATAAVQNAVNPDRVRQIGRWKKKECFEKHYVHALPEISTTDKILLSNS